MGPPILQPYYQLFKLLKKEIIYSRNASFIMRLSPYLNIGFLLAAAVLVPVVYPAGGQWPSAISSFSFI